MADNKHAQIRYLALDNCLRNTGRHFTFNDLLAACNTALGEHYPKGKGIQRRQLFKDLDFIKTAYKLEIKKIQNGRETYYRYENPKKSITEAWLNESEAGQVREAISLFTRFRGLPQFEWLNEITARLESGFNLKKGARHIIDFEQNKHLRGLEHITPLFNAILNERVLKISYKNFKSVKPENIKFHPYFLKQFNNRWFCFGHNENYGNISNLALDRIQTVKELSSTYITNDKINFEIYFQDIIGVTVTEEAIQRVLLQVDKDLWPYIETKPLHSTQRMIKKDKNSIHIEVNVKTNYELEALLLSHGNRIEVLEPTQLRQKLLSKRLSSLSQLSNIIPEN